MRLPGPMRAPASTIAVGWMVVSGKAIRRSYSCKLRRDRSGSSTRSRCEQAGIPASRRSFAGLPGHRVLLAAARFEIGRAHGRHHLDRRAHIVEAETVAGEDRVVARGVKIGEAVGEFHALAVGGDRAIGRLASVKTFRPLLSVAGVEPWDVGLPPMH